MSYERFTDHDVAVLAKLIEIQRGQEPDVTPYRQAYRILSHGYRLTYPSVDMEEIVSEVGR